MVDTMHIAAGTTAPAPAARSAAPRRRAPRGVRGGAVVRDGAGVRRATPFAPFRETPVTTRFARVLQQVLDDIHALDDAVVRIESPAALKRRFVGRARLAPLVLDVAGCRVVGGTEAAVREVVVPFAGDPLLWTARPTGCFPGGHADDCPEIAVEAGAVRFSCIADATDTAAAGLGRGVEEALGALAAAVARIARDVKRHNADAFKAVCRALQMKRARARLALHRPAAADPRLPTRRDVPAGGLPPQDGRRTRLVAPSGRAQRPRGFVLPDEEFARILEILRGCAAALGRSPTAARTLDADVVRTFLLIQLNAHYEWADEREAFTASADGDIVLDVDGRAAFVVRPCFWREPDAGRDALERALDGIRTRRVWSRAKAVLLLVHPEPARGATRQALHAAVAARIWCRPVAVLDVLDDGGEPRFAVAAPAAKGGAILVHGITCGLRSE